MAGPARLAAVQKLSRDCPVKGGRGGEGRGGGSDVAKIGSRASRHLRGRRRGFPRADVSGSVHARNFRKRSVHTNRKQDEWRLQRQRLCFGRGHCTI